MNALEALKFAADNPGAHVRPVGWRASRSIFWDGVYSGQPQPWAPHFAVVGDHWLGQAIIPPVDQLFGEWEIVT